MEGRRFSDGLHQALEAKEGVEVQRENRTLASITFQNFFRNYRKLSGMTGTATTEADEFFGIYSLKVIEIPTNECVCRKDEDDEVYATKSEKFDAVLRFIQSCNSKEQPVLVGTTSIVQSELLSSILNKHQLKHLVLNARYHEQEASIIARAGCPGAITIATNMAGRGTDIKLGGADCPPEDAEKVKAAGGLCVIGTERHESRRIDNQLRGRSGRQGDPGMSKFFVSLDDDLLRIFGSHKIKTVFQKLGLKEGDAIYHPWITKALSRAQSRVESRNYEVRKSLLKFDDIINEQRCVIFQQRNIIIDSQSLSIASIRQEINVKIVKKSVIEKNIIDREYAIAEVEKVYGIKVHIEDPIDSVFLERLNIITEKHLEDRLSIGDDNAALQVKKRIMLLSLDHLWKEHLNALEYLRQGVSLRAVGQKNPIHEFKRESFFLFKDMMKSWKEVVISRFARIVMRAD